VIPNYPGAGSSKERLWPVGNGMPGLPGVSNNMAP
jgi:hypothetical protein